ncbi:MAG: hypothetical protein QW794_04640 [Thermosphaera sp.]
MAVVADIADILYTLRKILERLDDILKNRIEPVRDAILSTITSPPPGEKIGRYAFEWNPDGSVRRLDVYSPDGRKIFSLLFEWNPDGTLKEIKKA